MTPQEKRKAKRLAELANIVPNWQKVNLTKAGYNIQWVETLLNLERYISKALKEKQ